jgi:hypothetical protein
MNRRSSSTSEGLVPVVNGHSLRRGSALLLIIAAMGCGDTPVVMLDVGATTLAVGDSLLVYATFGHHHPGFLRDDVHVFSGAEPTLFRWTSSDSSIVAVDGRGMIYARRPGAAEISAIYEDVRSHNTAKVSVVP